MEVTAEIVQSLLKEGLAVGILLPIVWYFLKKNGEVNDLMLAKFNDGIERIVQNIGNIEKSYEKSLNLITQTIKTHTEEESRLLNSLSLSISKTSLSPIQTIDVLQMYMWSVSQTKLDIIRNILDENHIFERQPFIKEKIRNELTAQSSVYLEKFSGFITPVGDLSQWMDKNFSDKQFDEFLDKIYAIIFKNYDHVKDVDKVINLKIGEIRDLMKSLQNLLSKRLKKDLGL